MCTVPADIIILNLGYDVSICNENKINIAKLESDKLVKIKEHILSAKEI